MKISVVMASYLGNYPRGAKNRVNKFIRAVNSFLAQEYQNKELIIISDGCDITENIYNEYFINYDNIIFEKIKKDVLFGGKTRNKGIELSSGDWICYLDTDDFLSSNHLKKISEQISEEFDWYFSDDYLITEYIDNSNFKYKTKKNIIRPHKIGTSSIVHRNNLNIYWGNGYGHDWKFIKKLMENSKRVKKIIAGYYVCHIPNLIDF